MTERHGDSAGTNILLIAILLTMSGVPVLAGLGSTIGIGLLFAGMGIAAIWQWLAIGFLVWAVWRFAFLRSVAFVFACMLVPTAIIVAGLYLTVVIGRLIH